MSVGASAAPAPRLGHARCGCQPPAPLRPTTPLTVPTSSFDTASGDDAAKKSPSASEYWCSSTANSDSTASARAYALTVVRPAAVRVTKAPCARSQETTRQYCCAVGAKLSAN